MSAPLYLALVHHPVRARDGATVTASVTNLDVHDLGRLARTYDVRACFIVTPIAAQRALVTLILALSDKYRRGRGPSVQACRELLAKLESAYERAYYAGILCERQAKALLESTHPGSGRYAYQGLREAMEHFEQAEELAPRDNDDAVLRWNTCARLLAEHKELARTEGGEDDFRPLLE